ncbi:unnamed protein product [Adineta ricciae]|uniref:Uncharacterized protein n=1 Tax=Adineta ricciae TaxID=249248 RepID=A0A815NF11_ADIRI|nr:unnamed protein product [Adineta ricciae]CAF1441579.1 unnamed protein product [Adineta ricciae]
MDKPIYRSFAISLPCSEFASNNLEFFGKIVDIKSCSYRLLSSHSSICNENILPRSSLELVIIDNDIYLMSLFQLQLHHDIHFAKLFNPLRNLKTPFSDNSRSSARHHASSSSQMAFWTRFIRTNYHEAAVTTG